MRNFAADFPALGQLSHGKPLVYLDSAATAMRPNQVLEAVSRFYREGGANPHRGVYEMGEKATAQYERARETAARFVGAQAEEIVFTRNATEGLNLVAYAFAPTVLQPGDSIVIPVSEHHSNLVPWQIAAKRAGAALEYLYLDDKGVITEEEIAKKITERTKIVAFAHVSNVLGSLLPVEKLVARARQVGAKVVLDCAQSVPHMAVNLQELDVDFAVFSGHKLYGPMGIGALYGKKELLEAMPPFLSGGDMIEYVQEQETTYAPVPQKFEAGTQNAGDAVGLAAAIDYVEEIGWEAIHDQEKMLMNRLMEGLLAIPYVEIIGSRDKDTARYGVVAFNIAEVHSHDVATILDAEGIAVRAGHHCAQPLMRYLQINASCRASLGLYNTAEDIDRLLEAIPKVRRVFGLGT